MYGPELAANAGAEATAATAAAAIANLRIENPPICSSELEAN
jgi:hypothetical protein